MQYPPSGACHGTRHPPKVAYAMFYVVGFGMAYFDLADTLN